jgi:hypothetical protein
MLAGLPELSLMRKPIALLLIGFAATASHAENKLLTTPGKLPKNVVPRSYLIHLEPNIETLVTDGLRFGLFRRNRLLWSIAAGFIDVARADELTAVAKSHFASVAIREAEDAANLIRFMAKLKAKTLPAIDEWIAKRDHGVEWSRGRSLASCPRNNRYFAGGRLAVFQGGPSRTGGNEAPISESYGSIRRGGGKTAN